MNSNIKELAENGELLTISPNIKDKHTFYYLSIENVLEAIKKGEIREFSDNPFSTIEIKSKVEEIRKEADYDKQNELKVKNLPVFYSGGVLNGKVEILCNTIFIDIDEYDYNKYDYILNELKKMPFVFTIFSTPRIKYRLKVGIKHNLKDINGFSDLYKELANYLNTTFVECSLIVDPSCSNPNKPIFFSYDPEIWINYDFEEYEFTKKEIIIEKAVKEIDLRNNETKVIDENDYWVQSEKLDNGRTQYYTTKGNFSTGNINKAVFDNFKFHYWNNDDFGRFELGNRSNWIFRVSLEFFQYVDSFDDAVETILLFNSTQLNRLDESEIIKVCNNALVAFKRKGIYNEFGCRKNYAITKTANWKRQERIERRLKK